MQALWASMAQQDFRAALARIDTPVLAVRGAQSQVYPAGASAFVAGASRGEVAEIPDAGHVPHLEAPDAFFNAITEFVRAERRPANVTSEGVIR
jgi:pimeloyl-ACP methyl ester carboxylesterase